MKDHVDWLVFYYRVYPISPGRCVRYSTAVPATAHHDSEFAEVQIDLEDIVSKLKATQYPEVRKRLLREMRRLLAEADQILD
jgi:hypothetical protein